MYHFIVNPVSRSGKGLVLWQKKIEPILKKKNIPYRVEYTKQRGDTTELCRKISASAKNEDNCIIVALGGDGTVNDAVQGIEDFENTTFALIPTGSGNDFAKDMKISKNVKKTLKKILSAKKAVQIDLGQVTTDRTVRKFAVSCGFGYDAAIAQKTTHSILKKRLNKIGLGKLVYLFLGIQQVFKAPDADADIEFDDGRKIHLPKVLFAVSMVHKYEGGGMMFCPKAKYDDGLLDMCHIHSKSVPGFFAALPFAFSGLHCLFPGIKLEKFKKCTITTSIPLWLATDGEVWQKADRIIVESLPGKLKFIY